jgi:hypothetical protein
MGERAGELNLTNVSILPFSLSLHTGTQMLKEEPTAEGGTRAYSKASGENRLAAWKATQHCVSTWDLSHTALTAPGTGACRMTWDMAEGSGPCLTPPTMLCFRRT